MGTLAAQEYWIGDNTLNRISDLFAKARKPYAKHVTVFYTDGKDHPTWQAAGFTDDKATAGVTVRVINWVQDMELRATVAVDVAACAGPKTSLSLMIGRGPVANTRRQTFRDARRKTMETLVHELRHVLKNWQLGLVHEGSRRNLADALYAAAYRKDGYDNAFERDAFTFAAGWIEANGKAVDDGRFDEVLPVEMIRSFAPA
jgi:hypothetical protein